MTRAGSCPGSRFSGCLRGREDDETRRVNLSTRNAERQEGHTEEDYPMSKRSRSRTRVPGEPGSTRRTFLKQVGMAGLAAAAGTLVWRPRASVAASPVKLSIWTGYPEVEPFYKKAAEEYAKTH